jgi:hypothetical protein
MVYYKFHPYYIVGKFIYENTEEMINIQNKDNEKTIYLILKIMKIF